MRSQQTLVPLSLLLATISLTVAGLKGPQVGGIVAAHSPSLAWQVRGTGQDAADCGALGVVGRVMRVETGEGFESSPFPRPGSRYQITDRVARKSGLPDEIAWGAVACEASEGLRSLWAVGGGSIGKTFTCDGSRKDYPLSPRQDGGVSTMLRYGPLDLGASRGVGVCITFDYKSRMPTGSLFVGVGDGNQVQTEGRIAYTGYSNFQPDTKGEWLRGQVVAAGGDMAFLTPVAGMGQKDKVEIVMLYNDPPPDGLGAPTTDMYGVFIDNLIIDVILDPRPGQIPYTRTPTAVPATGMPRPTTSTAMPTSVQGPATDTPSPTMNARDPIPSGAKRIFLPLIQRGSDWRDFTPPPSVTAVATPTAIPTATAEPTETTAPGSTPVPTATEVATEAATPTWTPKPVDPKGRVVIVDVIPFSPGASLEVVVLQNQGDGAEDLTGWYTTGAGRNSRRCDLPAGLVLQPQAYYEVRSGKDAAAGPRDNARFGPVAGHVCTADLIWDNNLDQAFLFDKDVQPRSKWCWNQSGPYTCP